MHKAYQPFKPAANKYLQKKWDQEHYNEHRKKVREAKPTVDTKGIRTPTHIQAKLKAAQVQEERQAIIDRDNQLLASKLADIQHSKGCIDHRNFYPECSLNSERRRAELLQVTHENQMIYKRITAQESKYRRELWEEDWARTEQRRDSITRYPRGVVDKQKVKKSVSFLRGAPEWTLSSSSRTDDGKTTGEELQHQ
ncbi:sperm axonemal maintenance protein CFAP97D1 [Neoarius graeffei]|uniref:sperm axonemal maintenance protein CFAP97D1 n=1 Tax=Neoarius graeffei TaxID=443677 RepID=UPI00298BEBC4|nr:sperm axonemal maintenance protein CFAP97D1 [Neoarius graeffei]